MTIAEKQRLRYRRQYILSPEKIDCPFFSCNYYQLSDKYYLYTHVDLKVTLHEQGNVKLILLGDLFDYESPKKKNEDILADICCDEFDSLLNKSAKYCGRFILLFLKDQQIYIFHDQIASRKIYYHKSEKGIWCSSLISLLALSNQLEKTRNKSKLDFYQSKVHRYLNNSNIGNTTIYDEVFQLLPNHYLSLNDFKILRYWFKKEKENLTIDKVAEICGNMLKGYLEAINERYKIMLPITAGKDSRTLLAATRDICSHVYYYINKEKNLSDKSNDVDVPRKLIQSLKLDFHVEDPFIEIDKDFEEIYYSNNESASAFYLPHIYNYYKNHSDKVNLPGNLIASGYDMYGKNELLLNGKTLARLNWVSDFPFAIDYYKQWLKESKAFRKENKIHTSILFYCEERLGNWGTQVHADKDMAQEDIVPFNSRLLTHYFLTVPPRTIDRPYFRFFKKIMKTQWPDVLNAPFNPSHKNFFSKFLYCVGILDLIRLLILLRIKVQKTKIPTK